MAGKDQFSTFRIRAVPLSWTAERLECFLTSTFEDGVSPRVHSCVRDLRRPQNVATASFANVPVDLAAAEARDRPLMIKLPAGEGQGQITIDNSFHGLTPLFIPEDSHHRVTIVAVSGIGSHAFNSFQSREDTFMWLRDALPRDITRDDGQGLCPGMARIVTYGYDSRLNGGSVATLGQLAKALFQSLEVLVTQSARPIIFIAHSLGGWLVKKGLIGVSKSRSESDQRIFRAVQGIVSFGVPHLGMNTDIMRCLIPTGGPHLDNLLNSLNSINSGLLEGMQEDWDELIRAKRDLGMYFFFETKRSPTPKKLGDGWEMSGPLEVFVTRSSAVGGQLDGTQYDTDSPLPLTHEDLVRFDEADTIYEDRVLQPLRKLIRLAIERWQSDPTILEPGSPSWEEGQDSRNLGTSLLWVRAETQGRMLSSWGNQSYRPIHSQAYPATRALPPVSPHQTTPPAAGHDILCSPLRATTDACIDRNSGCRTLPQNDRYLAPMEVAQGRRE